MRLSDAVLDACLCDVRAPLAGEPARDFGLSKEQADQALAALRQACRARSRWPDDWADWACCIHSCSVGCAGAGAGAGGGAGGS